MGNGKVKGWLKFRYEIDMRKRRTIVFFWVHKKAFSSGPLVSLGLRSRSLIALVREPSLSSALIGACTCFGADGPTPQVGIMGNSSTLPGWADVPGKFQNLSPFFHYPKSNSTT